MTVEIPPLPDDPLAEELERFVAAHRLFERYRALDRTPAFPREEYRAMGQSGWLGLDRPVADGGRGLSAVRAGTLLYRLAYRSGTTFAKLSLQPGFSSVLEEHGSPELVREFYRPLVRGEKLVANYLTEPDAGSDLGRIRTLAVRDGADYVLTGTKSEAAFVQDAEAAIVYARVPSDPSKGLTAFLVPQTMDGIRSEIVPDLGEHWMRRGQVVYDAVRLPERNRIGEEGAALRYVLPELSRERGFLAMIYLGVARASWEETVRRADERTVFGASLSEQQAVAFPLVRDWGEMESVRLYVERALERISRGLRADLDTALAKAMATEIALRVLDHAIQFHGGAGYSNALPHEQRWRDVRSGSIAHGSSETLYRAAARRIWRGRPARDPGSPPRVP